MAAGAGGGAAGGPLEESGAEEPRQPEPLCEPVCGEPIPF